jgi:hypothetical protein
MNTTAGLEAEDFDTLDNILDDLRHSRQRVAAHAAGH